MQVTEQAKAERDGWTVRAVRPDGSPPGKLSLFVDPPGDAARFLGHGTAEDAERALKGILDDSRAPVPRSRKGRIFLDFAGVAHAGENSRRIWGPVPDGIDPTLRRDLPRLVRVTPRKESGTGRVFYVLEGKKTGRRAIYRPEPEEHHLPAWFQGWIFREEWEAGCSNR